MALGFAPSKDMRIGPLPQQQESCDVCYSTEFFRSGDDSIAVILIGFPCMVPLPGRGGRSYRRDYQQPSDSSVVRCSELPGSARFLQKIVQ